MNRKDAAAKIITPLVVVLIVALILYRLVSGKEQERYTVTYLDLFDTVTEISGYSSDRGTFNEEADKIYHSLRQYNDLYDIYNDYEGLSNIKTINDNAGKAPVEVDERIIDLLLLGKDMYAQTDGMTNIAMGSVLSLWHDARIESLEDPAHSHLPDPEALKDAGQHMNINDVIIDEKKGTVFLRDPEMRLDVGAVAKGYAAQCVAKEAEENGIKGVLLSLGGNVVTIGEKPDRKPYNVGIQDPDAPNEERVMEGLNLYEGESLVTSGNYQRYFEVDGKKYCHIISPHTLYPGEGVRSVSIIAKDSAEADAFSTAVFLMPYEEGRKAVIKKDEMEAMWIMENGEVYYTDGFEERLLDNGK
ncbi:MAG: FAD:protein FMN transferase [Lachnospiraceae bacterium]|nr:FAD:protein FMN transferase [Lachnospiraceae bacterium]